MHRLVLIPVHNEQGTIGLLVRQCRQLDFVVWVIDDGSTDDSAARAQAEGARVLVNPGPHRGKTAALRLALSQLPAEAEWLFIMDGDGQHRPADLPRFYAERDGADLVVGDRLPDGKFMPLLRRWTNHFMSWLLSALFRSPVRDSQCGFRMIRSQWLAGWLPRESPHSGRLCWGSFEDPALEGCGELCANITGVSKAIKHRPTLPENAAKKKYLALFKKSV
jgi:glycosyltransferase involved in cell wall biosynthesis